VHAGARNPPQHRLVGRVPGVGASPSARLLVGDAQHPMLVGVVHVPNPADVGTPTLDMGRHVSADAVAGCGFAADDGDLSPPAVPADGFPQTRRTRAPARPALNPKGAPPPPPPAGAPTGCPPPVHPAAPSARAGAAAGGRRPTQTPRAPAVRRPATLGIDTS